MLGTGGLGGAKHCIFFCKRTIFFFHFVWAPKIKIQIFFLILTSFLCCAGLFFFSVHQCADPSGPVASAQSKGWVCGHV